MEYALPTSEAPTLAEVLSTEEEEIKNKEQKHDEPTICSALQADFLQGVSQQILQAQVSFSLTSILYLNRFLYI